MGLNGWVVVVCVQIGIAVESYLHHHAFVSLYEASERRVPALDFCIFLP